ncbi:MAG TPA: type II toxin-antitoxin system HicB family antitoxin [Thermoanaerobaculia bacterium]|nr:type II toxin-antitoxin system HicB family antitoxin [Thermoanaerobaculia bacterium]
MYKTTLEVEHLPEGLYLGTSPDLPGLIVQGGTVQEVLSLAPDVAHDLIAVIIETNQQLPGRFQEDS